MEVCVICFHWAGVAPITASKQPDHYSIPDAGMRFFLHSFYSNCTILEILYSLVEDSHRSLRSCTYVPWYNAAMTGGIQLIDTHLHLHLAEFDADREQALMRARAAQVAVLVEVGYDLDSSRAAVALAAAHPEIYAVVGIQPHYAAVASADWLAEIRRLAAQPKVVAIGEIGLDYYHNRAPHNAQEQLFREQLAQARELDLPVVIHSREAQADTVRILRDSARGQPGIMHSFSGDWAYAEACLEVGFQLSFSGPVTFAKATELHEVARR